MKFVSALVELISHALPHALGAGAAAMLGVVAADDIAKGKPNGWTVAMGTGAVLGTLVSTADAWHPNARHVSSPVRIVALGASALMWACVLSWLNEETQADERRRQEESAQLSQLRGQNSSLKREIEGYMAAARAANAANGVVGQPAVVGASAR